MNASRVTTLVAVTVVLAGCVGIAPSADSPTTESVEATETTTTETTTSETTQTTTTTVIDWPPIPYEREPGPRTYPQPPSNLTEAAVERTVERYESAYVYNTLTGVEGLENVNVPRNASSEILAREHGGVLVEVALWYSFEQTTESNVTSVHDGRVRAIYFVNATTVWRVDAEQPIKY